MLNTPVRSINESISKNRKVSCGLSTRSPVKPCCHAFEFSTGYFRAVQVNVV